MSPEQLREVLLLEVYRLVNEAASSAVKKFGKPVPPEAIAGFLSDEDMAELKQVKFTDFDNPTFQKSMRASAARIGTLSYPPDGEISAAEAQALESLKLSSTQSAVVSRVVAEAVHSAFFHFFALLDSVGDPEVSKVPIWQGADFVAPRTEGPMLHDDLGPTYYVYRDRTDA